MILLAVDPGLNGTGWAAFDTGRLVRCGCATYPPTADPRREEIALPALAGWIAWELGCLNPKVGVLMIEKPQVYRQRLQKGDPNDLIDLAFLAGAVHHSLKASKTELVLPREWKGTIPKTRKLGDYIVHKRVLKHLAHGGLEIYEAGLAEVPAKLRHNIADAVGIGLWALGCKIRP